MLDANTSGRAWLLLSVSGDRQYGGNRGYIETAESMYRYDSTVANHKQLSINDLVFVRERSQLLGLARVERISVVQIEKIQQRCPQCRTPNIKARKTKSPVFLCVNGHSFDEPSEQALLVTGYVAQYESTFIRTSDAIPVSELKAAALRPNDQMSIEEIDPRRLEAALSARSPAVGALFEEFFQGAVLQKEDGAIEIGAADGIAFQGSMADQRDLVLRSIRLRRGQQTFRREMLRRYGKACAVSGCRVEDILEAAHIWPYRSDEDNDPSNGLLLRADLHTLFDLNLLAIDPRSLAVCFHPSVVDEGYRHLEGRLLSSSAKCQPARRPLQRRWTVFCGNL